MSSIRVEEIDPSTASDDVLRSRWAATVEVMSEAEPEAPVTPFEQQLTELRETTSFERPRHLVAFDGATDEVAGYLSLELQYTESNRHLAWYDLGVRSGARRQHIASALLLEAGDIARNDGRTVIGSWSVDGQAGDDFALSMRFERKATERKSRLVTAAIDRAMMEQWVEAARTEASDYELVAIDGRTPEDLLDDFAELYHVTNTAPRDDLDLEDEVITPERLKEREDRHEALGYGRWRVLARHRTTKKLAGFTELFFPTHAPNLADQGWTAVSPEHRGHGIGRWLKAVNALRLLDERPDVEAIDTWNAFSNAPMLAINVAMGFELLRGYNDWQASIDQVIDAAKSRVT
ncbi:MAG TPA: GNAT family N-acetyltransferase [Acidimicrobiales bacterium]|jgi:mycothiol synthase|nr:GNAT family N-acetyltransferase [Acidimicrobiales bacterium]